ncbi:MAG: hypothetical protein ABIH63_03170 [archaeon]
MARDYDGDYGGSQHEPYVASQPAPKSKGLSVVLTIVIVIMVVFGGLYGYFYVTSPTGQRSVTDLWGRVSSGVSNFYNYLFIQQPQRAGKAFYSSDTNDTKVDYGVRFVNFQSVGSKKVPSGATSSFKYVVTVGENFENINLNLDCKVDPSDVIDGEISKIPSESLKLSSENPAVANNLRCTFKTRGDLTEDKTVTVKGSIKSLIPAQRASLKVYLLSAKEYERLKGQDFFKVNNKNDKLPIKALYNGEPVELGIGVAEDLKQPVIVGSGYSPPLVGITLNNRWEGKVSKINSLLLFLPEGVSIDDSMSPKSELCPFTEVGSSGKYKRYEADKEILSLFPPFGSGETEAHRTFECWLKIDDSLVEGKDAGFETAYHVDVSYDYQFNERSDVITVTKKLITPTETPMEGGTP